MNETQSWFFLAALAAFYGRLPTESRLQKLFNWIANVLAIVFVANGISLLSAVRVAGWEFKIPSW